MSLLTDITHWLDLDDHTSIVDQVDGTVAWSTISGTPATASGAGPGGQDVIDLSGEDCWISTDADFSYGGETGQITFAFSIWINVRSDPTLPSDFLGDYDFGTFEGAFYIDENPSGQWRMFLNGANRARTAVNNLEMSGVGSITNTNWYNHTFTNDGTTGTWYINGSSASTVDTSNFTHFRPGIGESPMFLSGHQSVTTLSEGRSYFMSFGCWNRNLTADEVATLYNSGSGVSYAGIAGGGWNLLNRIRRF